MKLLVTGGSGYLGTHVRRFFNADDLSRRSHLDVLNPDEAAMVAHYDVVIHLAGYSSKDPAFAENCFRTNVEGTANLLRRMPPNSVFIFASTKDVYGAHGDRYAEVPESCSTEFIGQSPLEWSKLIAERYVEYYAAQRNFRSCILRLSNVYARPSEGNESGFVTHYVESVKRGWPIRLPLEGRPVRDILHVDDFSRACRAFIDSEVRRGLYNLGGGRENALSLSEIIGKVAETIQCTPVIDESNPLPAPVPLNYISDLTHVREELGWQPQFGIEEGLPNFVMKLYRISAVAVSTLFLIHCTSYASDCNLNLSPCEAYINADAVFVGKVVRITPEVIRDIWTRDDDYDQTAYVSIDKSYKGYAGKNIVLHQLARKHSPKFVLGSSYLFYANRDANRQWWVKPCGRTRMSQYVQDDLRYLGALTTAPNRTRIAGEIIRYESDAENPTGKTERLPGIRVVIKGVDREFVAVTDADGIYEVLDAPPGKYHIEPAIPQGLRLWAAMHYGPFDPKKVQSLDVELQPKACAGLTIILTTQTVPPNGVRKIGN